MGVIVDSLLSSLERFVLYLRGSLYEVFTRFSPLPLPQYLLHYLLALSRWVDEDVWSKSHVTRVAWALLQDSFHTSLSLREPPHVVAAAVLYLAVHCCKLSIPGSDSAQHAWWEVFSPGCSEARLQGIAEEVMEYISKTNADSKES